MGGGSQQRHRLLVQAFSPILDLPQGGGGVPVVVNARDRLRDPRQGDVPATQQVDEPGIVHVPRGVLAMPGGLPTWS